MKCHGHAASVTATTGDSASTAIPTDCAARPLIDRRARHAFADLLVTWQSMHQRCLDPRHPHYHNYGGRGICICAHWRDFRNFLDDMGERPEGRSLDRIDTDGHYSCGACPECRANGWAENTRWATAKEQRANQRRSK